MKTSSLKKYIILLLVFLIKIQSFAQPKVLYYRDYSVGSDKMESALINLGYNYTLTTSNAVFQSEIIIPNKYDIAIYFAQGYGPESASANRLADFISGGGKGIYAEWTRNSALASLFGANYSGVANLTSITVNASVLIPALPQNPFVISNPGWGIFSTAMTALPGFTVDGTFSNGQAAIISNSSRTSYILGCLGDTPPWNNLYKNILLSFVSSSTISTSITDLSFCPNSSISVGYVASGTFNAGNIFTVQLSDVSGDFANPVAIGSGSSITSGSISATIPALITYGTGYRIRVVSDNPVTIGSDNGTDLTVGDNQPPIVSCPGNQTLNVIANTCAANYTIADPISDNCTGATWGYVLSGATTDSASGIADGTSSGNVSFNKGVTTVTLSGTDRTNTATTCSFTVTVNDNQPPTLSCPGDQPLNVVANTCAANYTIADPIADNCTGATWGYVLSGATTGSASGIADGTGSGALSFNKGATTVTLSGTDGTNTATTCSFTVTVNDNQKPTFTCPIASTVNLNADCKLVVPDLVSGLTGSDNCGTITFTQNPIALTALSSSHNQTHNVVVTADDGNGNTEECTVVLTGKDVTPPSIACPSDIIVSNDENECGAVVNYSIPNVTDNCNLSENLITETFSYSGQIVNWTVPQGVTNITILAKGARGGNIVGNYGGNGGLGASIKGDFTVTPNEVLKILVGGHGGDHLVSSPLALNSGGGGGSFVWKNSGNALLIVAGGGSGFGDCSYQNSQPGLATLGGTGNGGLGGNISCGINQGGGGGAGWLTGGGGTTANPNIGGLTPLNGGLGGPGDITDTYIVSTAGGFGGGGGGGGNCGGPGGGGGYTGGNGGDNIICIGGQKVQGGTSFNNGTSQINTTGNNNGDGIIIITYSLNTNSIAQTTGLSSGSVFPIGTTINTFVDTDTAGNSSECSFTVTVNDTEKPNVTAPSNVDLECSTDLPVPATTIAEFLALSGASATDNCTAQSALQLSSSTSSLVNGNCHGTITRTYTVTDESGNFRAVDQVFTVTDNTIPSITSCPGNGVIFTRNTDAGNCSYKIVGNELDASGSDNCSAVTMSYSIENQYNVGTVTGTGSIAGLPLSFGLNTINWIATDECGNASIACVVKVNINKVTTTTAVTVTATSQQYSDKVSFQATITPFNCSGAGAIGGKVVFRIGNLVMGEANVNIYGIATLADVSLLEDQIYDNDSNPTHGPLQSGLKTVTAHFVNYDTDYDVTDATTSLTISCEDAEVSYNGQSYFAVNPNNLSGTVVLSDYIVDKNDGVTTRGDIRNATATFESGIGGSVLGSGNLRVGLVNPINFQEGFVSTSFNTTLSSNEASNGGRVYDVYSRVNNYYCGTADGITPVTIAVPGADYVTGGGHLVLGSNSSGKYAGTTGKKMNFGFVMKWNKSGKNLQGKVNVIYRRSENGITKLYQIKGTAINSLVVENVNDEGITATGSAIKFRRATIITKANLTEVTNPLVPISLGGNYDLTMTAWESTTVNTGVLDRVSVQLSGSGSIGVLFSSNWVSGKTVAQTISGGKVQVRNSSTAANITAKITEVSKPQESSLFKVIAYPNPSKNQFTLKIEGGDNSKTEVMIFSVLGRLVKRIEKTDGQQIFLGEELPEGNYFAIVKQGPNQQTVKLIKKE